MKHSGFKPYIRILNQAPPDDLNMMIRQQIGALTDNTSLVIRITWPNENAGQSWLARLICFKESVRGATWTNAYINWPAAARALPAIGVTLPVSIDPAIG